VVAKALREMVMDKRVHVFSDKLIHIEVTYEKLFISGTPSFCAGHLR
jgi:hypothetical protein